MKKLNRSEVKALSQQLVSEIRKEMVTSIPINIDDAINTIRPLIDDFLNSNDFKLLEKYGVIGRRGYGSILFNTLFTTWYKTNLPDDKLIELDRIFVFYEMYESNYISHRHNRIEPNAKVIMKLDAIIGLDRELRIKPMTPTLHSEQIEDAVTLAQIEAENLEDLKQEIISQFISTLI